MAAPTDLLDPPTVMSYSGLVDASTAEGQVDEAADWRGAIAAMLVVPMRDRGAPHRNDPPPATHLSHITGRKGAYPPAR
jgi:hypothetical protein